MHANRHALIGSRDDNEEDDDAKKADEKMGLRSAPKRGLWARITGCFK